MQLVLGMKFYTKCGKSVETKGQKIYGADFYTFVDITGEKLFGSFLPPQFSNFYEQTVAGVKMHKNAIILALIL